MAVAALLAACGGSSSDANQPAGTYHVKVVTAQFPTEQRLGQTSLLRIGVRNTGQKTVPALTVTASIAGKEGQAPRCRSASTTPSRASPNPTARSGCSRRLPEAAGSSSPGGAATSNVKTFDFGPLKPGATTEAVWKLSAVKAGRYTLLYKVDAGLSGTAKAEAAGGVAPGRVLRGEDLQRAAEHRGHRQRRSRRNRQQKRRGR